MELFSQLSDRAAEQISGGKGIGQRVSELNQSVRESAQNLGYQNHNKVLKDGSLVAIYPGQEGFEPNDNNRTTDTNGEARANFIHNELL